MSDRTEAFKRELNALLEKYDCSLDIDYEDGNETAYFTFSDPHEELDDWKVYD